MTCTKWSTSLTGLQFEIIELVNHVKVVKLGRNLKVAQMNYFRAYSPHPILLRGGANPAFPHAFAEAIKLSASQFDQYSKLSHDEGSHLNFLMELALDKLPFLAFAKSLEDWRWDIYDGVIKVKNH